jgi:hypothetical protein
MNIHVTPEQWQKIRLISDHQLYFQAQDFMKDLDALPKHQFRELVKQLKGLENSVSGSGSLKGILDFVRHQVERDWGEGPKKQIGDFYNELKGELEKLRQQVEKEGFVPADLNKKDAVFHRDHYAFLLAREFIRHLIAENYYKSVIYDKKEEE